MSSTINASTASGGGVITSADASGILQLQTGGTTALTIDASQNVTLAKGLTVGASAAPAFSAYQSTLQTITGGTASVKILFQTEEFDTNNNYSSSRFTPTVAGYYQVNAAYQTIAATVPDIELWKNGAVYKYGVYIGAVVSNPIVTGAWVMYCNGTTDYLEIYGTSSVTGNTNPTSSATYFQAAMIRSA